jgi:hypothetical protein
MCFIPFIVCMLGSIAGDIVMMSHYHPYLDSYADRQTMWRGCVRGWGVVDSEFGVG